MNIMTQVSSIFLSPHMTICKNIFSKILCTDKYYIINTRLKKLLKHHMKRAKTRGIFVPFKSMKKKKKEKKGIFEHK